MQPYTYTKIRQVQPRKKLRQTPKTKKSHHGLIVGVVILLGLVWSFAFLDLRAHAATPEIKSGQSGYCLDDYANNTAANATVDAWDCNNSVAQNWTVSDSAIKLGSSDCLSVRNNATAKGSHVVLNSCNAAPGQVWLRDKGGYNNPNSGLCLNDPNGQSGVSLIVSSCNALTPPGEQWTPVTLKGSSYDSTTTCNSGTEGQRVACYAEKEWTTWQSGSPSHNTLLNQYTDGNGYEEWCADFVSYVYKEAGYPFTTGERNGWDEYNANAVQYDGNFTLHAAYDYTPQPGDIAYFSYSGGHVEIVVSGGQTPTFVYGDSGTIDPASGNGDMEANTITSAGAEGQIMYYLSPN